MDFVRKVAWRLILTLIIALLVLVMNPSLLPKAGDQVRQIEVLDFGPVLAMGLVVGFLLRGIKIIQHIDTWLHEFGHALTVTAFRGVPSSIKLNSNASGSTSFRTSKISRFREVVISAAGPLASAFTLWVGVGLIERGFGYLLVLVVGTITILVVVSTVRSAFGWLVGLAILTSISVVISLRNSWFEGLELEAAPELYLGAVLGLSAGVGLRSAMSRVRFHGSDGDEGKIAKALRLPEVLVDWMLIISNSVIVLVVVGNLNLSGLPRLLESLQSQLAPLVEQITKLVN